MYGQSHENPKTAIGICLLRKFSGRVALPCRHACLKEREGPRVIPNPRAPRGVRDLLFAFRFSLFSGLSPGISTHPQAVRPRMKRLQPSETILAAALIRSSLWRLAPSPYISLPIHPAILTIQPSILPIPHIIVDQSLNLCYDSLWLPGSTPANAHGSPNVFPIAPDRLFK